jgi:hypothetical protein
MTSFADKLNEMLDTLHHHCYASDIQDLAYDMESEEFSYEIKDLRNISERLVTAKYDLEEAVYEILGKIKKEEDDDGDD